MKKMMKSLMTFLLLTAVLASCSKDDYDDTFLRGEIDAIKTELAQLKERVSSVEGVVKALNESKVITHVEASQNGKSYTITFNDASVIEVLRGGNASAISIQQEDEVFYWTLTTNGNTEFLLDESGKKLEVAPKYGQKTALSLDKEGYWTVNNKRIKDANDEWVRFSKGDGEVFFKEVIDKDDEMIFVLNDGERIIIEKSKGSHLFFVQDGTDNPFYTVKPGPRGLKMNFKVSDDIKGLEVVEIPEGWTSNIHLPNKYVEIKVPKDTPVNMTVIKLQGVDKNGLIYLAIARVGVAGKDFSDPNAVFVLNEGNMTTENGSLIYIDGAGKILPNAYKSMNGAELGNVTQDLFIANDKMYIISQNGGLSATGTAFDNDGILVVANAKSLKRVEKYNDELKSLSWPSHIAVLDDQNIFIRDNHGVHHFNTESKALNLVEGSSGARKNPMVVADGKVFGSSGSNVFVMEKGQHKVTHTIQMEGAIGGIVKAADGNVWVATSGKPQKITKLNSKTYEVIKSNEITEGSLAAGMYSTPSITAVGNIIYYGGGSFNVYRHDFESGKTELVLDRATFKSMVSDAGMVYNTMAVHPVTGHLFINTMKGYGWDFLINNISEFSFDGDSPRLVNNYKDYTHFPAGIFFPANFK